MKLLLDIHDSERKLGRLLPEQPCPKLKEKANFLSRLVEADRRKESASRLLQRL